MRLSITIISIIGAVYLSPATRREPTLVHQVISESYNTKDINDFINLPYVYLIGWLGEKIDKNNPIYTVIAWERCGNRWNMYSIEGKITRTTLLNRAYKKGRTKISVVTSEQYESKYKARQLNR